MKCILNIHRQMETLNFIPSMRVEPLNMVQILYLFREIFERGSTFFLQFPRYIIPHLQSHMSLIAMQHQHKFTIRPESSGQTDLGQTSLNLLVYGSKKVSNTYTLNVYKQDIPRVSEKMMYVCTYVHDVVNMHVNSIKHIIKSIFHKYN